MGEAAGGALYLARGFGQAGAPAAPDEDATDSSGAGSHGVLSWAWVWAALAFVAGAALMSLEVVWFRTLAMITPNSSAIFAVMLAVVLAGIAAGGFVGGRLTRGGESVELLPGLFWVSALLTLLGVMNIPMHTLANGRSILFACLALMFPVSVCSGLIFILLGRRLRAEGLRDDPEQAALLEDTKALWAK